MDIWATLQNDDYGSSRVLGFVYGLAAYTLHTNGLVNDSQTPNKFRRISVNEKSARHHIVRFWAITCLVGERPSSTACIRHEPSSG